MQLCIYIYIQYAYYILCIVTTVLSFHFTESNVQIAGTSSAYFPINQDCWMTKSDLSLEKEIIATFENELKAKNINGPYTDHCLMCG